MLVSLALEAEAQRRYRTADSLGQTLRHIEITLRRLFKESLQDI
jgi:hypothetical protein